MIKLIHLWYSEQIFNEQKRGRNEGSKLIRDLLGRAEQLVEIFWKSGMLFEDDFSGG